MSKRIASSACRRGGGAGCVAAIALFLFAQGGAAIGGDPRALSSSKRRCARTTADAVRKSLIGADGGDHGADVATFDHARPGRGEPPL